MQLSKHHGLGNDFLVALDDGALPDIDGDFVRGVCDRHTGAGADGFIVSRRNGGPTMELWNSDGSSAEISGNGLRCLAQALVTSGWTEASGAVVRTAAGERKVSVESRTDDRTWIIRAEMGRVEVIPVDDAVLERLPPHIAVAALDLGNPHVVIWTEEAAETDLGELGPALEAVVRGGVNVHVVNGDGDGLMMRSWERGVGVTEACGTGACAAATAATGWLGIGPRVPVRMPGGEVHVEVGNQAVLTGPATHVANLEYFT